MKKLRNISVLAALAMSLAMSAWAQTTIRVVESNQRIDPARADADTTWVKVIKDFEAANPDIKVEVVEIPPGTGNGAEGWTKIDIMTAAGDTYDIVELPNPVRYTKYVNAGFLMPLNDLAKAAKYDLDKAFGGFLKKYDGKVYWLPREFSANIVYYNKAIFDAAKVPYPKAGWTWDDYAATAKKLTDAKKGIWGSIMQQWEYFFYVGPQQKNIAPYKADGTSNFDNPEYAKWLQFYADLGKNKAQPDWAEMVNKKYQWDSFMTGKFGMTMVGTWHLGLFTDVNYVRDWKFGVVAPPVPADGKGNNMLVAGGALAMNKKAAHPKEAFRFLQYMAENYGKTYSFDPYPARADLTKEALQARFAKDAKKFEADGVTADDLSSAIMNPKLGAAEEKISGTASGAINSIVSAEGEKFLVGAQSLADTIKNLKKKADDAIAKEKAAAK